jgi:hypothetical protein
LSVYITHSEQLIQRETFEMSLLFCRGGNWRNLKADMNKEK